MSVSYKAVQWSPTKKAYDLVIVAGVMLYVLVFVLVGRVTHAAPGGLSDEILIMRGLGTCGFLMMHVILCIGPLCRIDRRFLPLLYNRRHLGVAMFAVSLAHAILVLGFYHGFGILSPPV